MPASSSITTAALAGVSRTTRSCSPVKKTLSSVRSFANFSRGVGREAKMKLDEEHQ